MSSAANHERYMKIAIGLACSEIGRKEAQAFWRCNRQRGGDIGLWVQSRCA